MGKKEKNAQLLYEALKDKGRLSVEEMMTLLNTKSRKSVYNYINVLEAKHIAVSKEMIGHKIYYSLVKKSNDIAQYQPIDKDVLRNFSIVKTLQKHPMEQKKLLALYDLAILKIDHKEYRGDMDFGYEEGTHEIDVHRTQFDKIIKHLLDDGVLHKVEEKEKNARGFRQKKELLYPTGKLIPVIISYNEDEYWDLYDRLDNVPAGHPYYKELRSAGQKLKSLVGDTYDDESDYFYSSGRGHVRFASIRNYMQKLPLRDCSKYIAKYNFTDKNGVHRHIYLAAGMIVYSAELDKIYIAGKRVHPKKEELKGIQILNVESISSIEVTAKKHHEWMTEEFRSLYQQMFSISVVPPKKVKVKFDNIFNIRNKVLQLLSQRKNAKVTVKDDYIMYEDSISGLDDFAVYLRRYGRSCYVAEPQSLKKLMTGSVDLSLERYKEAGYGTEL